MSDTRVPPAATDLIPPEQWIEIVGAIGYDESADPAIFKAIEHGARLAVANELDRISPELTSAVCSKTDEWDAGWWAALDWVGQQLGRRAAELREDAS